MGTYEVLPVLIDETGEEHLHASYTPNNGIRIGILNKFSEDDLEHEQFTEDGWDCCLRSFDLSSEQARQLGQALIRWADDNHGFPRAAP